MKAEALGQAESLARFVAALALQGYGQIDRGLARTVPALQEALQACGQAGAGGEESKALAGALFDLGIVLQAGAEETGLRGFRTLANHAGTLSLLFTGFALQGNGRKRKPGSKRKPQA